MLFERYCQDVVSELLSRRGCQGDVVDEILSRRCCLVRCCQGDVVEEVLLSRRCQGSRVMMYNAYNVFAVC